MSHQTLPTGSFGQGEKQHVTAHKGEVPRKVDGQGDRTCKPSRREMVN